MTRRSLIHRATPGRRLGTNGTRDRTPTSAAQVADEQPTRSRGWHAALATLPYVGAIGAGLYGVLRLAYVFFYIPLRTTPEETGYGYAEILASQLVGAFWLVAILALPLFVICCGVLAVHTLARRKEPQARRGRASRSSTSKTIAVLGRWSLGVAVVVVLVGLPIVASQFGADAAKGITVRNVSLQKLPQFPVLAVQAVPANVTWVSEAPEEVKSLQTRKCLMYLGRSAGTAVLYDVSTGESLRVPEQSVLITLRFERHLPTEDCKPPAPS